MGVEEEQGDERTADQFTHLLRVMPERYAEHEGKERVFNDRRAARGKEPVSILRDRRGGETVPLTMQRLREEIQAKRALAPELFALNDASCSCFDPPARPPAAGETTP